MVLRITIVLLALIGSFAGYSQGSSPNKPYATTRNTYLLDSVFPVEDILSITVANYSGRHVLTKKELGGLKSQLKQAKFAGGLLVKPGHITMVIKLKNTVRARPGFVYATTGAVHFDGGTDRSGKRFSGTWYLPVMVNFDNYR